MARIFTSQGFLTPKLHAICKALHDVTTGVRKGCSRRVGHRSERGKKRLGSLQRSKASELTGAAPQQEAQDKDACQIWGRKPWKELRERSEEASSEEKSDALLLFVLSWFLIITCHCRPRNCQISRLRRPIRGQ